MGAGEIFLLALLLVVVLVVLWLSVRVVAQFKAAAGAPEADLAEEQIVLERFEERGEGGMGDGIGHARAQARWTGGW